MAVLSVFLCSVSLCDMLCNAISVFHETRGTLNARGFRCSLPQVFAEMKTNKDTRYKQTYYRPDYILDRIDVWVDFEHFAVSL